MLLEKIGFVDGFEIMRDSSYFPNCLLLSIWLLLSVPVLNSASASTSSPPVDISPHSIAWGPGLDPSVVLPARYFFIQAVDSSGQNYTASPGASALQLSIDSLRGRCPIFQELLDRKDGTYLARYRLYEPCDGLQIAITTENGQHVAGSPFVFEGKVMHADCDCPVAAEKWKELSQCPLTYSQIDRDLEQFAPSGKYNMSEVFEALSSRFHPQSACFCYYMIKNQRLYKKCFGEHVGFAMFMDQLILLLLRRTKLPDVEFVVNLGDYPLSAKYRKGNKMPVFSWCGADDHYDIVMPTYDVTESSLHAMDRVSLDMLSVQATQTPVWQEKIPKAFWRGRDAREERLKLVQLGRNNSDLIDAGLTHFFFFRDQESLYGPTVPSVNFFQFFQYKYQLNLDGTVAAYRFPYLLAGDSLVFKQESAYYEHFYHDLQPWTHYIPVRRDLDDLVEQLQWARSHDEEAQRIAKRGSDYARENLLPVNVFCYYVLLFEKWSSMTVMNSYSADDGFAAVPQVPEKSGKCDCGNNIGFKEEL
ncbi:LOW QUALITY PROTEIN: protein O-glucosyltransferase 2-like [Paramacrobiotus metropolitanus]|uniref:LOW QUALITY PROTEIN: protein O-glucosyltransferase 2-like n=1 Tax=Paramacrobiotus metropolitanus TaxID=2943436 RepID=UPI00244606E6|nr:LOW QUALITY PROTEIN: protein O-glucosyltransferase 2-like [Paramacrobiotus metropolitanus]